MPDVLIIQDKHELCAAKDQLGDLFAELSIVAWTPSAVEGLMEEGINFCTPLDCINVNKDVDKRYKWLRSYSLWCSALDNIVQEETYELTSFKITPFVWTAFQNRSLFLLYFNEIDKLNYVTDYLSPNKIWVFRYSHDEFSPLSKVIEQIQNASWNKCEVVWLAPVTILSGTLRKIQELPNWVAVQDLGSNSYLKSVLKWLKGNIDFKPFSSLLIAFFYNYFSLNISKKKSILIFSISESEGQSILRQLSSLQKYQLVFWEDLKQKINNDKELFDPNKVFKKIENDVFIRNWLVKDSIDIYPLCIDLIKNIIYKQANIIYNNIIEFNRLYKKMGINLLVSSYELPISYAVSEQAASKQVNYVNFLHGGTVGHWENYPTMPEIIDDGGEYTHRFVYTRAIAKHLLKYKEQFEGTSHCHAVGSNHYSKLLSNKLLFSKETKIGNLKVCYVCGNLGPMSANDVHSGADDSTRYRIMVNIVKKFKDKKGVNLYVKYGRDIEQYHLDLFNEIDTSFYKNIKSIKSSSRLTDIMWDMDVFLIDFPQTPFCELQVTDAPILSLVDPRVFVLTEEAKECLPKSLYIVDNEEGYYKMVDQLINGLWKSKYLKNSTVENRDNFYSKYCTDNIKSPDIAAVQEIEGLI